MSLVCALIGASGCSVSALSAQPSAGFPLTEESAPPAPPRPAPRVTPSLPAAPVPAQEPPPSSYPPAPTPTSEPLALPPVFPALLPYRPGLPVPPGYHVESYASSGLVITGSITFALAYLTGLGVGLNDNFKNGTGWLAVPLIGPWAAIGARDVDCRIRDQITSPDRISLAVADARRCFRTASKEATDIALLAGDGIVQVVGLALLIAGVADQTHELVRNDAKLRVVALPRLNGGLDLGLRARF